ncbi:unnamed protein product [Malus baccata var. baccata]
MATRKGGFGWVSRDIAGNFKGAGAFGNFPCESSVTAEAEAVRAAHLVCVEKGFLEVQGESDSKCPVGMINGSKFNMTLCLEVSYLTSSVCKCN